MEEIYKVLVVDDDPGAAGAIVAMFETEKFEASSANSGAGALKALEKTKYDLLVADLKMPGMDGITLIEKAHEKYPLLASILVTGYGSEESAMEAFTRGKVNYYLRKPFERAELLRFAAVAIGEAESRKKAMNFHEEMEARIKKATKELVEKNRLLAAKEQQARYLLEKMQEDQEKIQSYARKLEHLSVTDGLTKVYNHRRFNEVIRVELERSSRYGTALSLVSLDIDDFKKINDTYGHMSGDAVLKRLGTIMIHEKRNVDIAARCGGEEFSVLLPQIDMDGAKVFAERLRKAVAAEKLVLNGVDVRITVSVGVAVFPTKGIVTVEDLIKAADDSLYFSKNIGKNRVTVYTENGLIPLGEGEAITKEEKNRLKQSIINFVARNFELGSICGFMVDELSRFFSKDMMPFYCSIFIKEDDGRLNVVAEKGAVPPGIDVGEWAAASLGANAPRQTTVGRKEHPFSSLPIITETKEGSLETLAVLNMNRVPMDTGFISDLLKAISLAVRDAMIMKRLDGAAEVSRRNAAELAVMNDTLVEINRFGGWDKDLSVAEIAELCMKNFQALPYDKVRGFSVNTRDELLIRAVSRTHAESGNGKVSLGERGDDCRIKMVALARSLPPPLFTASISEMEPEDIELAEKLGLEPPFAVMPLWDGEATAALFFFEGDFGDVERFERLKNFFNSLRLSLQNNINARRILQLNHRFNLLVNFSTRLSAVDSETKLNLALKSGMEEISNILYSSEISIYAYHSERNEMEMLASPEGGNRSIRVSLNSNEPSIMRYVVENFLNKGARDAVVIENVGDFLNRESRTKFKKGAYLGLPLIFSGELLGIVNITERHGKDSFSENDMKISQAFASVLAMALYSIRKSSLIP